MKLFLKFVLSLWGAAAIAAAEPLNQEKRTVDHFECIEVHGSGTLFLKQGTSTSLTVKAMTSDLPKITTAVHNNCLIIGPKKEASLNGPAEYFVVVDRLKKLKAFGNVTINTQNTFKEQHFVLSLSGSSRANMKLQNESFEGKISGNSEIFLQGKSQKQWLEINGHGMIDAKKFTTEKTTVSTYGHSLVTVKALQELDANINGAGIVKYYGNPKIHQKISGNGEIIPVE